MPKTLEETYDRVLLRIEESHRQDALKILQWLAFAARPVRVDEAAEVLAIDLSGEPCYNPKLKLFDPRDITLLCPSLITRSASSIHDEPKEPPSHSAYYKIKYEYFDVEDFEVIGLAHLSVKDYLVSDRIRSSQAHCFAMDAKLAHTFIAQTCIVYLSHSAFASGYCDQAMLRTRIKEWPLYYYATYFWPFHVKASSKILDDGTWQLLQHFFQTKEIANGGNFAAWVVAITPDIDLKHIQNIQPLFYTASFGVTSLIRKLLESDPKIDIEALGGQYDCRALQVAAYRNHPAAVRLLLEAGANPMALNVHKESSLYWAILRDYVEVQDLLKSYGATLTTLEVRKLKYWQEIFRSQGYSKSLLAEGRELQPIHND